MLLKSPSLMIFYFIELIDISKQKKAEHLKHEVERIVKHDMKTPINTVIGFSQLLLNTDLDEDQLHDVQMIYAAGHELNDMIGSSLDIYKMEEDMYKLCANEFDLLKVVTDLQKKLSLLYSGNINLIINNHPSSDDQVYPFVAEKKHIKTVLSNLLNNAYESSPGNEDISLSITTEEDNHLIAISNKGEIPDSIRNSFFEKYATEGKQQGTGLGTYSAKLIVEAHKGSIGFKSEKGRTTVSFKIPKLKTKIFIT